MKTLIKSSKKKEILKGYRMIVEATGQGLWSWDLLNNEVYYTRQWKQQIGYKNSEFKNSLESLREHLHADDKERFFEEIDAYLQQPEGSFDIIFRLRHKNGSYIWIRCQAVAQKNKEGEVVKLYGLDSDITSKKEAVMQLKEKEAKYRLLFEQSPIGLSCSNVSEYIVPNKALARMLGYPVKELEKKNWREITHPDDISKTEIILQSLLEGKRKKARFEKRLIHKDGSFLWVEINVKLQVQNNSPSMYLATISDITRRITAEKEVLKKNEALKSLNANKDKLFSIISHDLRSPVSSIMGVLDMIYSNFHDFKDNEKIEILKSCLETAKNTHELIETLLEWARSQTGSIEVKQEELPFFDLVQRTTDLMEKTAARKNIGLRINIPLELRLIADKNMVNTVLRNLLTNSIKFTPLGGKIDVKYIKTERNLAAICVEDNGIGIDKENIHKLFDIGAGYTTPGTENEKGTGLGLILCKEFIQKNGGDIWIKSKKGKGTCTYFTLPVAHPHDNHGSGQIHDASNNLKTFDFSAQ